MAKTNKLSEIMQNDFAEKNLRRLLELEQFKELKKYQRAVEQGKPTAHVKGLRIKFLYDKNGKIVFKKEINEYNTARLIIYSNPEKNPEKKPYYEFIDGEPTDYALDTLNKTLEHMQEL